MPVRPLTSCRGTTVAGCLAAAACLTVAFVTAAGAADKVRYVSTAGSNANNCKIGNPCRSLQRGINRTPAGGELRILDSGDYGTNGKIKKSLTINGNGHTVTIGSPITINDADAVVALRDLVLDGQGQDIEGVFITAAAVVHIERCVVRGFLKYGVFQNGADARLFILDSIVRDNLGGVFVNAGTAAATIDNSRFENNSEGLLILGVNVTAAVSRTVIAGNIIGIRVASASVNVVSTIVAHNTNRGLFAAGTLTVESSVAYGNAIGLSVFAAGDFARISDSTFTGNGTGIANNGTVETRENNTVRGNTIDLTGNALTPIGGD